VLAEVIGNLLGNCARHASGAPVRVHAQAVGPRVVVEVADDGPGVPRGFEQLVLGPGVRNSRGGGDGLGLHLSRELLTGAGGMLQVMPSTGAGCTVVAELPRATTDPGPPQQGPPEPAARVAAPAGMATIRSADAGSRP